MSSLHCSLYLATCRASPCAQFILAGSSVTVLCQVNFDLPGFLWVFFFGLNSFQCKLCLHWMFLLLVFQYKQTVGFRLYCLDIPGFSVVLSLLKILTNFDLNQELNVIQTTFPASPSPFQLLSNCYYYFNQVDALQQRVKKESGRARMHIVWRGGRDREGGMRSDSREGQSSGRIHPPQSGTPFTL